MLSSAELYTPDSVTVSPIYLTQVSILANGAFYFTFTNAPGSNFSVSRTADLLVSSTDWTLLDSAIEVTPSHFEFTDPQAANDFLRFYRVQSP